MQNALKAIGLRTALGGSALLATALSATAQFAAGGGTVVCGNSIAIAKGSTATGGCAVPPGNFNDGAIAIGPGATAGNDNGSLFETQAGDTALGQNSSATVTNGTALGNRATVTGTNSTALGANSTDGGQSNVVSVGGVGSERRIINVAPGTAGTDAINLNQLNAVDQRLGRRIANLPQSAGLTSVTHDGTLTGDGTAGSPMAVAPSVLNSVTRAQSTADAGEASATQAQGTANQALGLAQNSVQYDKGAHSSVTLDPGGSTAGLHNVAAGVISASSTDAINGSQLNRVTNAVNGLGASTATNFGGGTTYNPATGTISAPSYTVGSTSYNNVGDALSAINTTGIKYFHTNSGLGDSAATGRDSLAVGPAATSAGPSSIAMGTGTKAAASGALALGAGASAGNANDVALGSNSATSVAHAGAFSINGGAVAATSPSSVVSVGQAGQERQVQNVGAGVISASSTDAINGSQLYAVGSAVNTLGSSTAASLGGGATYDSSTGTVRAPSYQIANNAYTDVGLALNKLNQEINGPWPTVVRYDTDSNGKPLNSVTLTGVQNGQPVAIHNVAPGSSGTDAVNLNQLGSIVTGSRAYTDQQVSGLRGYVDNRFAGDETRIVKANRLARAAGAAAMAAANLRYDDKPYAGSVAASLGGWMGQTAIASGIAYNWNTVRVNSSVTYVPNTNAVGWGAGASWRFW